MGPVTFTDTAVQHIKHMLEKNAQSIGFRLTVKKTGCSGLAYVSAIIEQPVENDIHFVAQNDLSVFIDPAALQFIQDLQVDYVESAAQGLKQKRLVFMNPKETGRCGCGESFTIE